MTPQVAFPQQSPEGWLATGVENRRTKLWNNTLRKHTLSPWSSVHEENDYRGTVILVRGRVPLVEFHSRLGAR